MLNKFLAAAALCAGVAGMALPTLAQPIAGPPVIEERILERVVEPDGTTIHYVRVVRADGTSVIMRRIISPEQVVVSADFPPFYLPRGTVTGGVGGSIGGRMILGTTPAGNIPLPVWR